MFFKKPSVPTVTIELVNVRPYRPVIQLRDTPISTLPEVLEPGTEASLGRMAVEIVEATPGTRDRLAENGYLRLVVRYLSTAEGDDEAEHVYATVCPQLPPFEDAKRGDQAYQIAEGDWRQVEFVSRKLAFEIEQTLAGVQDILDNHEVEGGYDRCFRRDLIPSPLAGVRIPYDGIKSVFAEGTEDREGLAILGYANAVEGGFAFRSASLTDVYGYTQDGIVFALCLGGIGTYEYDSQEVQAIADFSLEYDLCLVDWAAASKLDPETDAFFAYFDPPDDLDTVYEEAPL